MEAFSYWAFLCHYMIKDICKFKFGFVSHLGTDKRQHREKTRIYRTDVSLGVENLKNYLLRLRSEGQIPCYEPLFSKKICNKYNVGEAFSTIHKAMTSTWHSQKRREFNKKRTVAILSVMEFGFSQKCRDFHGQLLLRSGLLTNVLNLERVLGTSMSNREYQLIKVKDSSDLTLSLMSGSTLQ